MNLARKSVFSVILAVGLWLPTAAANAEDQNSCPVVAQSIVEGVLGQQADFVPLPGVPAGMDACEFDAANDDVYTIVRENAVFAAGTPVAAGDLTRMFFPQLTDDTVAQISADQAGTDVSAPGFDITSMSGLGDSAVVAHTVPATMVTILVRRGTDWFIFQTDDLGAGQAQLTSLAQAVLAH